jgi:flagellar assembly factor FliW
MSPVTFSSSRFGELEIDERHVLSFPQGLIGLGGSAYALISLGDDRPFAWLHSLEDADVALPVTNPFLHFPDYAVELSDDDTQRIGAADPADVDVWVTVRAAADPADFTANLRAPIVVHAGRAHQVINEAADAPVRAKLFAGTVSDQAA